MLNENIKNREQRIEDLMVEIDDLETQKWKREQEYQSLSSEIEIPKVLIY